MAGYVATTENWDALLEEDYVQGQIVSAVNTATPFRDKLKRVGMTAGRRRVYAAKVGTSQGQGARAEGAQMPVYGAGEYQDVLVSAKYNYAPFKITGQSEEFSDRAAFVRFGMQILKDTKEGMRLFTGRQSWGDGQGKLALVNGALVAGDSTITVDSPYGVLWGSLSTLTTFLIKRQMVVAFGAENNGGAGYTVTSVGNTTFVVSPVLQGAVADNVAITMNGSADLEIEGWLLMVATSSFQTSVLGLANDTYHGIDRSAFPEWEGNVINIAAALSLTNIRTLRDTIYKRTDDEESNLFMCSTEIVRDYEALLQPGQRFVPATKLEGGHTIIEHDGLRLSKDSKAPIKAFSLADTKAIAWAQTRDPHWKQDGTGIMRVVPGQDAKEALLLWYANLDCEEPRRMGIGYNVTVS
jgi:hypothetical protein